jgi:hypothetical protein
VRLSQRATGEWRTEADDDIAPDAYQLIAYIGVFDAEPKGEHYQENDQRIFGHALPALFR